MSLETLAIVRANVPRFFGASLPEQLEAGRAAAEAALRKHALGIDFEPKTADEVLAKVEAWALRNESVLAASLSDMSAAALPKEVQIAFDTRMAQRFIVATFVRAAAGLGPWRSGLVAESAASGAIIGERWAREDAEWRLQVFGAIVRMEADGYLATLFGHDKGLAGLGAVAPVPLPIVVAAAVVVTLVLVAALVLVYVYSSERLRANNALLRELCLDAQKRGDQARIAECIQLTAMLQKESLLGTEAIVAGVVKVALVSAVVYLGFKLVPPLLEARARRQKESQA